MKCKYVHTGSTRVLDRTSKEKLRMLCDMQQVRMNTASLLINIIISKFKKMQKCSSKNFPSVTSGLTCHQGKTRARNSGCLVIPDQSLLTGA